MKGEIHYLDLMHVYLDSGQIPKISKIPKIPKIPRNPFVETTEGSSKGTVIMSI
jgi:hypothetical protein